MHFVDDDCRWSNASNTDISFVFKYQFLIALCYGMGRYSLRKKFRSSLVILFGKKKIIKNLSRLHCLLESSNILYYYKHWNKNKHTKGRFLCIHLHKYDKIFHSELSIQYCVLFWMSIIEPDFSVYINIFYPVTSSIFNPITRCRIFFVIHPRSRMQTELDRYPIS